MINIYIFGYGSLQNFNSIEKTLFSINDNVYSIDYNKNNSSNYLTEYDKTIQIVKVKDLKRGWLFHTDNNNKSYTACGAYECTGYTCSGTLFPVTEEQLANFDLREIGYQRKIIDNKNVSIINRYGDENENKITTNSIIYYYSVDNYEIKPNIYYPLYKSYIDLCMTGCLMIDKIMNNKNNEYTIEFVETTYGWEKNKFLIDDRINLKSNAISPYIYLIDDILDKYVKQI